MSARLGQYGNPRRPAATDAEIEDVLALVRRYIQARMVKHGRGVFLSAHETIGVCAEEWDEVLEALRGNDAAALGKELADLAVACLFGLVSMTHGTDKSYRAQRRLEDLAMRRAAGAGRRSGKTTEVARVRRGGVK